MRIFVNALSMDAPSGQHVLMGHLSQLAGWTETKHEFLVLHHSRHAALARKLLPFGNVQFVEAPQICRHWTMRAMWESMAMPRMLRRLAADRYFTPAGTIPPTCPIPHISLAQNPWCLVPEIHRSFGERMKARLQRVAYRKAAINADLMVYNSRHMQVLYAQNAARAPVAPSIIAYQGINDVTHDLAERCRGKSDRKPLKVLAVSVMAHWKGIETVVRAIGILHKRGIPAELSLVGPWADVGYERFVRSVIAEEDLRDAVTITGKVSVAELHEHYATARVFSLMSRCESFGIPAVEAQAFGTPVVGSNTTAMAEIGGKGGVFGIPGDPVVAADLMEPLLTDDRIWSAFSMAAIMNSQRFRWKQCSAPLMAIFESIRGTASGPEKRSLPKVAVTGGIE